MLLERENLHSTAWKLKALLRLWEYFEVLRLVSAHHVSLKGIKTVTTAKGLMAAA